MKTIALLSEVLSYQNPAVVKRFAERYRIEWTESEAIFVEMKRWLWLCASSHEKPVNMVGEAFIIDEMWHTFLLFTKDYMNFCDQYFRQFIHHVPKAEKEKAYWKDARANNPVEADRLWRETIRADYERIYDTLGAETLLKWCKVFPEKYKHLAQAVD